MSVKSLNVDIEKWDFISLYISALENSRCYWVIDSVRSLVADLLDNKDIWNENDSLIVFLKKGLDLNIPLTWLLWAELEEAFEIRIAWVKIIADIIGLTRPKLSKTLVWSKFIMSNYMLVFNSDKIIFCDVSNCDIEWLKKRYNQEAINKVEKNIRKNSSLDLQIEAKWILEALIRECKLKT